MRHLALVVLAVSVAGCNCGKAAVVETRGVFKLGTTSLDFGPVTEFTTRTLTLELENTGRSPLAVTATLEAGTSADFTLGEVPTEIPAGATVKVSVTFAPIGAGLDTGSVRIVTDDADAPASAVPLTGGPIAPALAFEPDPLVFAPVTASLVTRTALLRSVGGSTLHVTAVGVSPTGNADFSLTPPMLPLSLAPDASVAVQVQYARSLNANDGRLEVVSDDADAGLRSLRLVPDPAKVCGDGLDNDSDGLTDFPDDVGCTSADDNDEYNPPECVNGGAQPCGASVGICRQGTRVCANSVWGGCDGGVRPTMERCNGLDDDCNGMSDESLSELCTINGCAGARACVPNSGIDGGLFTACIPVSSMPEQCNGVDDNCNGAVDEGVVQACTVAGCAGVRICLPGGDGGFTSCMPANPLPETCNGLDDDCNGQTDDLTDVSCGIGPCRRVVAACVDSGPATCTPGTPGPELCNGVDDDCNNTIDDGIAPRSCGVGACAVTVNACLFDGGMSVCLPGMASPETCNNVDDNCNGATDEQLDGGALRRSCYSAPVATRNIGVCRDGTQTCASGSFGASCAGEVIPGAELCNSLDDDCNMAIDDAPDGGPLRRACFTVSPTLRGVGRCRDGQQTCSGGAFGGACSGEVLPIAETCNAVDDDCNTRLDDGPDGGPLTQSCYSGPGGTAGIGRCRNGTRTCLSGSFGTTCPGEVVPAASETCGNSIDDNCNNQVDEACDGGACNTGGTWLVVGAPISYSCAEILPGFSLVNVDISEFNFSPNTPSAGTISILPQFTWSPGPSRVLRGPFSPCPSGTIDAGVTYAGTCTERYQLNGAFTSATTFSGVFTMTFTGSCFDCTAQSFPVQLSR